MTINNIPCSTGRLDGIVQDSYLGVQEEPAIADPVSNSQTSKAVQLPVEQGDCIRSTVCSQSLHLLKQRCSDFAPLQGLLLRQIAQADGVDEHDSGPKPLLCGVVSESLVTGSQGPGNKCSNRLLKVFAPVETYQVRL